MQLHTQKVQRAHEVQSRGRNAVHLLGAKVNCSRICLLGLLCSALNSAERTLLSDEMSDCLKGVDGAFQMNSRQTNYVGRLEHFANYELRFSQIGPELTGLMD